MVATLVQSVSASSSAAGPASITVAPASTGTGTFLLLFVSVTATSGAAITTPTNWALLASNSDGSVATALFSFANNPGSITSVAVTVTATGGGAVATFTEWSSSGTSPNVEYSNVLAGNANSWAQLFTSNPSHVDELMLIAVTRQAATSTPVLSSDFGSATTTASTNGTPNVNMDVYTGLSQVNLNPSATGSLGATVHFCVIGVRFHTLGERLKSIIYTGYGAGIYVGG